MFNQVGRHTVGPQQSLRNHPGWAINTHIQASCPCAVCAYNVSGDPEVGLLNSFAKLKGSDSFIHVKVERCNRNERGRCEGRKAELSVESDAGSRKELAPPAGHPLSQQQPDFQSSELIKAPTQEGLSLGIFLNKNIFDCPPPWK